MPLEPKSNKQKVLKPPWWNEINLSRQAVNRAKRLMIRTRAPEDREAFKAAETNTYQTSGQRRIPHGEPLLKKPGVNNNKWGKLTKWLINGRREAGIPSVLQSPNESYTDGIDDTIELLLKELVPIPVLIQSRPYHPKRGKLLK